ncbi:unnamed protein product [Clonostachys solani]|uniref:Rhodopsin domain-containing protein n=1 Tax=Clonostachys solani TaxID=160281 RepID=A0A9N9Z7Q2_9HYPO|nr:unnamed protein product [Clonostachys solani]
MAAPMQLFDKEHWESMLRHIDDTREHTIIAVCSLAIVLSLSFLGLRLYSRRLAWGYLKLDWSDWLCIGSVLCTMVMTINMLVGIKFGLGRHMPAILIIANATHPSAMAGLKLSLLVLYYSIFPSRRFRWCCIAMGIFVMLWVIASTVSGVALCIPIQKLWDSSVTTGFCVPLITIGLVTTASHIFTDIAILLMPVPLVVKLHTSRDKKILIISTFMVGGLVCAISIARLPLWMNSGSGGDFGWDNIPGGMLAVAEITISTLAASAPVYGPLISQVCRKSKANLSGPGTNGGGTADVFTQGSKAEATRGPPVAPGRFTGRSITVTDEFELHTYHNVQGGWRPLSDTSDGGTDGLSPG